MRLVSKIFQPVITIPKNAKIKNTEITCKSQKLLLELGLVRPTGAGLFAMLPLASRALRKLERLVRTCVEGVGAQPVTLPSLTNAGLWETTGRLQDVGSELMMVEDRHHKQYVLAPTHEEAITDLLADVGPISYKQLPLLLYQMTDKHRDELRPKHGLLRARSFRMMDAYGFHTDEDCARRQYDDVTAAYTRLFELLRLPVHRVEAPTGDMGGSFSHEWQLCAGAGEDAIDVCLSCSHAALAAEGGGGRCEKCGGEAEQRGSIEVGHTFSLGDRYSAPLHATFTPAHGAPQPLHMACYGVGVTRLLAASLEALSSETSLRWPEAIAPFSTIIIGPKVLLPSQESTRLELTARPTTTQPLPATTQPELLQAEIESNSSTQLNLYLEGSKEWSSHGWESVQRLHSRLARDVLVDDRHHLTIGKRLMMADRMGYPTIIVCGKSTLDPEPKYEVYRSLPNQPSQAQLLTAEQLVDMFHSDSDNDVDVRVDVENKV